MGLEDPELLLEGLNDTHPNTYSLYCLPLVLHLPNLTKEKVTIWCEYLTHTERNVGIINGKLEKKLIQSVPVVGPGSGPEKAMSDIYKKRKHSQANMTESSMTAEHKQAHLGLFTSKVL